MNSFTYCSVSIIVIILLDIDDKKWLYCVNDTVHPKTYKKNP